MSSKFSRLDFLRTSALGAVALSFPSLSSAAQATKKAKKFVKKARVLVDDKPQALLNLPEANDYK